MHMYSLVLISLLGCVKSAPQLKDDDIIIPKIPSSGECYKCNSSFAFQCYQNVTEKCPENVLKCYAAEHSGTILQGCLTDKAKTICEAAKLCNTCEFTTEQPCNDLDILDWLLVECYSCVTQTKNNRQGCSDRFLWQTKKCKGNCVSLIDNANNLYWKGCSDNEQLDERCREPGNHCRQCRKNKCNASSFKILPDE